ncbi:MAG: hypothetical protein J3K34DRAFT_521701 [Monoraphidium minutum]|nr:MAG: hypothetical protein J3K34DRAFT_521701 [Monoraphidium minutum]
MTRPAAATRCAAAAAAAAAGHAAAAAAAPAASPPPPPAPRSPRGAAGRGAAAAPPPPPPPPPATDLTALPCEVLAAVAERLRDREDRAAFAATFSTARAAAAAAATALTVPAAALLAGCPHAAGPALAAALARHPRAARVSVAGPAPPALAAPNAGGPCQLALTLVLSLASMRSLSRLDLGSAPAALYERLPMPLLRSVAAGCPGLTQLDLSAHLWHAPAQAAVMRVMARPPAGPACGAPPAAAASGAGAPPPACPAGGAAAPHWGAAAAAVAAAAAAAAAAAQQQQQQRLATALLSQALAAQAQRESLACLAGLPRLSALTVSGSLPPDVLPQLPALPAGVTRLSINCGLLGDDAALGSALGGLRGLQQLALVQLPSADGAVFAHMTGLTALKSLEISHAALTAAGLAPLASALRGLEALQLTGCAAMHSPCRAQLPDAVTRLSRLAALYLDFTLHVRDLQVLVQLPCLAAMAVSQLHACASSHFSGRGFQRLTRLALHSIEPDACTCLAVQVPAGPPPPAEAPPHGAGAAAAPAPPHVAEEPAAAFAALQWAPHPHAAPEQMPLGGPAAAHAAPPHAPAGGAPPQPHPPRGPPVERVGLLVALCPVLKQLSVGCGSASVLRAVERHESLQQLVMHGQAPAPPHHAPGGAPAAAAAAGAAAAAARGGGLPSVAAIEGHTWGLLRHGLGRLSRLALMNTDVLLGGSPSPALPLLALSDGGAVSEVRLMRYSAASDAGLAFSVAPMRRVRALALGGCTNVTDAGVICLGRLPDLETLSLTSFPRLTDAGVYALLTAAPRLVRLSLADCRRTTAQGVQLAAEAASKARGSLVRVEWARR